MNVFEFVLGIVFIVTVAGIIKARMGVRKDMWGNETNDREDPRAAIENARLRDEVRTLKERVQVLERVVTDEESGARIDREIEKLRDKNNL